MKVVVQLTSTEQPSSGLIVLLTVVFLSCGLQPMQSAVAGGEAFISRAPTIMANTGRYLVDPGDTRRTPGTETDQASFLNQTSSATQPGIAMVVSRPANPAATPATVVSVGPVPGTRSGASGSVVRSFLNRLEPRVSTYLQWDDNLLRRTNHEESLFLAVVSPDVRLRYQNNRSEILASYQLDLGRYLNHDTTEFVDHELFADWRLNLQHNRQLVLRTMHQTARNGDGNRSLWGTSSLSAPRWSDRITRDDSFDFLLTEVFFDLEETGMGAAYYHGNRSNRTRFQIIADQRYLRFSGIDADLIRGDRDTRNFRATYFWHLTRRLSIFGEAQFRHTNYIEQPWDSTELRMGLGSEFNIGRRIEGTLRIGHRRTHFNELSNDNDQETPAWSMTLNWRPRIRSTIYLFAAESINTNTSANNVETDSTHIGMAWLQRWSPRLISRLEYTAQDVEFTNARSTDVDKWAFRAGYHLSRQLVISLNTLYERGHYLESRHYDRTVVTVRADYTF